MSSIEDRLVALMEARRASYEEFAAGRTLNPLTGQPGFPRRDPYPPGASNAELDAFSKRTGIELPDDVRAWLRITNGATGYFGIAPTQEGCDIEEMWSLAPEWQQRGWIPVGVDAYGNYYVRVSQGDDDSANAVCFVEGTNRDKLAYAAATDTLHFATFSLKECIVLNVGREHGWPFDESLVLSQDPGLAEVTVAPLPWDA